MIDLLRDDDMMVRQRATDCLIHIADAKIVPEVMALMRDKDVNIRRCAIEVLKNLKDPATSEELMRSLKDSDWWVRQIATSSLTELHGDNNITRSFITLTRDPDENLRRCAVEFFNKVIDPAAYDALIERLEDEDWWVREKAIRALGKLKNEQAVAPLLNKLDDREVAWSVPSALAAIGNQEAIDHLKRLLFADTKRMRIESIKALASLKSKEAVTALMECLADPNEEVAAQDVDALNALTGKAYKHVPREDDGGQVSATMATHNSTPGSTVTEAILVLDLCNSTDITNRYGDTFSLNLLQTLTNLVAPIANKEQCRFSKGTGDGFLMTFPLAENAVRFAQESFVAVAKHNAQADEKSQINIRFSVHQGEAKVDAQGDRLGLAVSMTFRVEGVKPESIIPIEGGMTPEELPMDNRIVITESVMKELQDMPGINARLVGLFELKGITGLHRIYLLT
jgi:HEAT repeat protein